MNYLYQYQSKLGKLAIASDGKSITGLWMDGQKYFASTADSEWVEKKLPVFELASQWLDCYFAARKPDIKLPLNPKGSPFRQAVWKLLCEIPYGEVTTYGELAKKIAAQTGKEKMSAQAIGGAVGHNPISIIIPCHRVVGANGSLTGYAGGLQKKMDLLAIEGIDLDRFFVPKKGTAL